MTSLLTTYKLRWKRRRYLWRSFKSRGDLVSVSDNTAAIGRGGILCFVPVRNEMLRLPHFLAHYRALGVAHFLFVDNDSDDGTREYLAAQPDVSLWSAKGSYKSSRFAVDWLTWLLMKYGHGRWCLTVDADELLIYPHHDTRPLRDLTDWLSQRGLPVYGALMLDLYPKGRLGAQEYQPGDDPTAVLNWFDPAPYTAKRKPDTDYLWVQGGPRARMFFTGEPARAPTLNKLPLVKWNRRYAYVNSTHSILPRRLNLLYDGPFGGHPGGVLLHTKFLPNIADRAAQEKARGEHFSNGALYAAYYDALCQKPDLWCETSLKYTGWEQLENLGLMPRGTWL